MEARTITEVKLYVLVLNNMQAPKIEYGEVVAVSPDYDRLVEWYTSQKAPEMWRDGRWGKAFAKGSALEWYTQQALLSLTIRNRLGTEYRPPGWKKKASEESLANTISFPDRRNTMIKLKTKRGTTRLLMKGKLSEISADTLSIVDAIQKRFAEVSPEAAQAYLRFVSETLNAKRFREEYHHD